MSTAAVVDNGVPVNVGSLLKTNNPLPVSSDIIPANWAEVVDANWERFPVVASVPLVGNVIFVLPVEEMVTV